MLGCMCLLDAYKQLSSTKIINILPNNDKPHNVLYSNVLMGIYVEEKGALRKEKLATVITKALRGL